MRHGMHSIRDMHRMTEISKHGPGTLLRLGCLWF